MTPQQAQQQATRLTWIWDCERKEAYSTFYLHSSPIILCNDVYVNFYWDADEVVGVLLSWDEMRLWCQDGEVRCLRRHRTQERTCPFLERWLPFFRRSCFLMGLPIEATAHEKAEWMQGFSREELEAWNLKM